MIFFQSIVATTLALVALASSAPVNQFETLARRGDTCTVTGTEGDSQSVSYGIGATGTSASGNLLVDCTNGKHWSSGRSLPNSQTVKASDTSLAQDIHWKQSWKTGGYKSCSASYGSGADVSGKIGSNIQPGVGTTSSSYTCSVTFDI